MKASEPRPTRRKAHTLASLIAAATLLITVGSVAPFGARADAQLTDVVRVATIPNDISAEVYYAQDMGFFKKHGLDNVKITGLPNGGAIASAVAGGAMDIGYTGAFEVLNGREKGIDFTILAPANEHLKSAPTATLLGVLATSSIHTAKDLNGKTIGVSPLRGGPYIGTRAWIDKNGGDSSTVHFIELKLPLMAAAVKAGRVDAAVFVALADPNLGKPGDAFRLLGCAFDAIAPEFVPSHFITTEQWVKAHPKEAREFADAMKETAIWANGHHEESAKILAKYTKFTVAELNSATRVTYAPVVTPQLIQPFIDAAVKYGVVPKAVPGKDIISAAAAT